MARKFAPLAATAEPPIAAEPVPHDAVPHDAVLDEMVIDETAVPLALPSGARLRPDGTVELTLDYPVTLKFAAGPGAPPREQTYRALSFARLTGADMAAASDAQKATGNVVLLARSAGLAVSTAAVLARRLDASDAAAAYAVIGALAGIEPGSDLPATVARQPDGTLIVTLAYPRGDAAGAPVETLTLRRLTGGDLQALGADPAAGLIAEGLSRATGTCTPAEARVLLDGLDAADWNAISRSIGFLAGSGRATGR